MINTRTHYCSKKLFVLFFFFGLISNTFSQQDTTRILFVGNSFTYYYNLPQVVDAMAISQGKTYYIRQSTVGGSTIEQHWKSEKGTKTRTLLDQYTWDYIVFNHHSLATIDSPESFLEYSKKFVELVRQKRAKPIFMETWAYKANPLMIHTISKAYEELGVTLNVDIVPCGKLIAEVRKWRPDIELFADPKHPSYNGTYLLGLAFTKYFTGQKTTKIPERLTTKDINGELLYLMFMPEDDADFLQQLVDDYPFNTRK